MKNTTRLTCFILNFRQCLLFCNPKKKKIATLGRSTEYFDCNLPNENIDWCLEMRVLLILNINCQENTQKQKKSWWIKCYTFMSNRTPAEKIVFTKFLNHQNQLKSCLLFHKLVIKKHQPFSWKNVLHLRCRLITTVFDSIVHTLIKDCS